MPTSRGQRPRLNNFHLVIKSKQNRDGQQEIERVRRICLSLPGTWEKTSHGEPTWFVGKRVFAMFSNNHHGDGHVAVTVPAAIGIQEMLIKKSPKKFYRPPYVGPSGWVGIEVDRVSDKELEAHIREAWRLIAPAKLSPLLTQEVKIPKTSRRKTT